MDKYNIAGLFAFLSLFTSLITLSGILIFKDTNYQEDSIIYFSVTGLITAFCIAILLYNIIKIIKESFQNDTPLRNDMPTVHD